jgi:hypothetical protein
MMSLMPNARRRMAFTLVELLVVITIITVLVGLLMSAVSRARDAGKRTDNIDRMAQVGSAVGFAKQKVNMPYVWSGPFNLKGQYDGNEPELDILLTMFPNMMTKSNPIPNLPMNDPNQNNGLPSNTNVTLDANQALVLLLTGGAPTEMTGFSTDPRKPFAKGGSRKGPFLEANPKWFSVAPLAPTGVTLNTLAPNHPWLIDPFGVPYAVFAATKGKNGNYGVNANPTLAPGAQTLYGVSPYQTGTGFVNATSFQIISAGKDKGFGAGGGNLPATNQLPSGEGGEDDQANFSRATLGSGIQ